MAAFCKPVNRGGPEGLCFLQLCLSMSLRSKLRICTIALCVRGSAFKCRTLHVLVEFSDLLKLALANTVVLGQCLLHDALHAIEDILVVGPFCLRLRVAPRTCHAPAASRTRVRFFTALRMTPVKSERAHGRLGHAVSKEEQRHWRRLDILCAAPCTCRGSQRVKSRPHLRREASDGSERIRCRFSACSDDLHTVKVSAMAGQLFACMLAMLFPAACLELQQAGSQRAHLLECKSSGKRRPCC